MEKNDISKIIITYLSGRFTPETERRVQKWIIQDNYEKEKEDEAFNYWNELDNTVDQQTYRSLEQVNKKIGYNKVKIRKPLYRVVSTIAAVFTLLVIASGSYFYYRSIQNEMVEITVAYGEEKYIVLPDDSEVWINAGTSIKYPKKFTGKERQVYLNGEAYFSVSKDSVKPFIVQANQLSVKVLGTRFNLKAYPGEERITTTLSSGRVEITTESNAPRILHPNEKLIYNTRTTDIKVEPVSPNEADAWTSGHLVFSNVPFSDIVSTLERTFNVTIENHTHIPDSKLYTVKFIRNEDMKSILQILESMVNFTYEINNQTIILK